MIRSDADQHAVLGADEDEFDLARRLVAQELQVVAIGEGFGADPVKTGHGARTRYAEFFELDDMFFQRFNVAAGPAGDDHVVDPDVPGFLRGLDRKLQGRRHELLLGVGGTVTGG